MTLPATPFRAPRMPLVIVGAGGHGRVVLDAARATGWCIQGFLDSTKPRGHTVNAAPILGPFSCLDDADWLTGSSIIVAVGDQVARRELSLRVLRNGGQLATVYHPSAIVSSSAVVGRGTLIAAGVVVVTDAVIGDFCILNTASSVDHDVILADGVQICPGARLAGRVICNDDAFVGTGAMILPGVKIGNKALVGAGAVVLTDVGDGVTVVGNPARPIVRPAPVSP